MLIAPLALLISFAFLGVMLYKRVNLGITLTVTALLLAFLSLSWSDIPMVIYNTSSDLLTISVVLATFGIMLLSQLYKETTVLDSLSGSLSRIIKNPKIVLSVLPAVIGFLPVAGGALMSAPLVDAEAEKLKMRPVKKAYVNLWFRHTIFPIYPLSQVLIVTAALSGTAVSAIILRQIPVVAVMAIVGFAIGFWKVSNPKNSEEPKTKNRMGADAKEFFVAFSPILASIVVAIGLDMVFPDLPKIGFDVLIAVAVGLIVLIGISKPTFEIIKKPLKEWGIYGITLAAYGAFLLGSVIKKSEISQILGQLAASGNVDTTLLLVLIPAVLGVLTASALGGVSISIPLLKAIFTLTPSMASLIYMSSYLGYVISPTHLCFAFTAHYFKCPLEKVYKYVLPSFVATFATVLLIYFLI